MRARWLLPLAAIGSVAVGLAGCVYYPAGYPGYPGYAAPAFYPAFPVFGSIGIDIGGGGHHWR